MNCEVNEKIKFINFLYKFKKGVYPRSYGKHVAKLANIPQSILDLASIIADKYRKTGSID